MKFCRLLLLNLIVATCAAQSAEPRAFELSSSSFRDGVVMNTKHAGMGASPNCVGKNLSPQLSWHNAPAATRSFVFLMIDPEGRNGLGVTHWVAYGIPAERTAFAEGEASRPPVGFLGGKSTQGLAYLMGPCTPPMTSYHHYTFLAMATDLAADALPAGLTREELMPKLEGHLLASAGLVMRFKHR